MSTARYSMGDFLTFRHDNTTIIGHMRGQEFVSDPRRRIGPQYVIETASHELFDVHISDIRGLIGDQSCVVLS